MSPNEIVGAIVAELYRRVRNGRLGHLQRALNVGKNFFSHWKSHPASVRLLPLAEALEYLEIEPADFFTSAFNHENSLAPEPTPVESSASTRLESLLKSLEPIREPGTFLATTFPTNTSLPSGPPPAGVIEALARMAALSSDLAEGSSTGNLPGEMIDRQELTRLEELRWDNPEKANLMLERAISSSPIELLAEILLVYGTTFRQLDRLGAARWAYFVGEMRAKETGDRDTFASILQRRSWVDFAEGNFSVSLDLLRRAAGTFAELGDGNREAKALVSMAIQYVERGKFGEALTCATSALQKLNKNEYHHRFSAHQVLAVSFKELGDTFAALQNLKAARALLIHCPKNAVIRFIWVDARLKKAILPLETAAHIFEEAASFLGEIGEVQGSVLAMLEFVNCLVSLGNHKKLRKVAEALKGFAFRVDDGRKSGRLSATALMEVYRAILNSTGSETLALSALPQTIQRAADALETPASVEV